MNMGETINFYGSLLCLAGCLMFVGVYTVMAYVTGRIPWWRSRIGRMLVTKALAIAGLMLIIIVFYLFEVDATWIRTIRGVFAGLVGTVMFYQAWLVYRLQRFPRETE